jgi:hypothetical protein
MQTNARLDEYVTYAPRGESCAYCGAAFTGLETVLRKLIERQSGPSAFGPYVHYRKCPPKREKS